MFPDEAFAPFRPESVSVSIFSTDGSTLIGPEARCAGSGGAGFGAGAGAGVGGALKERSILIVFSSTTGGAGGGGAGFGGVRSDFVNAPVAPPFLGAGRIPESVCSSFFWIPG